MQIAELEKRRAEAISALNALNASKDPSPKVWLNFGPIFGKLSRKDVKRMLEEGMTSVIYAWTIHTYKSTTGP